jgi:hypothetical protein
MHPYHYKKGESIMVVVKNAGCLETHLITEPGDNQSKNPSMILSPRRRYRRSAVAAVASAP